MFKKQSGEADASPLYVPFPASKEYKRPVFRSTACISKARKSRMSLRDFRCAMLSFAQTIL